MDSSSYLWSCNSDIGKNLSIASFFRNNLFGFMLNESHLSEKRNQASIKRNATLVDTRCSIFKFLLIPDVRFCVC